MRSGATVQWSVEEELRLGPGPAVTLVHTAKETLSMRDLVTMTLVQVMN